MLTYIKTMNYNNYGNIINNRSYMGKINEAV